MQSLTQLYRHIWEGKVSKECVCLLLEVWTCLEALFPLRYCLLTGAGRIPGPLEFFIFFSVGCSCLSRGGQSIVLLLCLFLRLPDAPLTFLLPLVALPPGWAEHLPSHISQLFSLLPFITCENRWFYEMLWHPLQSEIWMAADFHGSCLGCHIHSGQCRGHSFLPSGYHSQAPSESVMTINWTHTLSW